MKLRVRLVVRGTRVHIVYQGIGVLGMALILLLIACALHPGARLLGFRCGTPDMVDHLHQRSFVIT